MQYLTIFLLGLFLIAAFFRVDFFFYILYFFAGVYFLSRLWSQRALEQIRVSHDYSQRVFAGERIPVKLHLANEGLLPLAWLHLHESLPIALRSPNFFRCVVSLGSGGQRELSYELDGRQRGYYELGPTVLGTGDFFGFDRYQRRLTGKQWLIVYPRIVSLEHLGLPARLPFGEIVAKQRLYEDPSRMMGVRDYVAGDSLRHIDWKTTATQGKLQVRRFEPAISIEAQILLDFDRDDYTTTRYIIASELGITTAAAVANYLSEREQRVGLSCNGCDPLGGGAGYHSLLPKAGRAQMMQLLELLARIDLCQAPPFIELVRRASLSLSWGGTAVVIVPDASEELFQALLDLLHRGYHVVLIATDPGSDFGERRERWQSVGMRVHQVWRERDLDVWR